MFPVFWEVSDFTLNLDGKMLGCYILSTKQWVITRNFFASTVKDVLNLYTMTYQINLKITNIIYIKIGKATK